MALVVIGVVLLGGGGGHTYSFLFENAGQLVKDDDVQVGGRRIGSVRSIELTSDNQAKIKVEVQAPYAPLHEGTSATIRATSLSGIANRYIALVPGPDNKPKLSDNSTLKVNASNGIVDLDQLFATLDPKTRKSLQGFIQGNATYYQGREREASQAAEYFDPALSTSRRLVNQLTQDEGALTAFIVNSSKAVTALADRKDDLTNLVTNSNTTASAIGSENVALSRALAVLPSTLRRGNSTFVNLRSTLDDLDRLTEASLPATKNLAKFLRALRPLVHDLRPTIGDLRKLIRRSGPGNDLVEATQLFPSLEKIAQPALEHGRQALVKVTPVLEFARPFTPDLVGWFRDFGFNASNYDANGHYARIQPIFNAFQFDDNPAGGVLTAQPASQRGDNFQTGMLRRCPGAATQVPEDKSAPFTDNGNLGANDCDPNETIPGP